MVEKRWNTKELQEDFTVHSFLAPYVLVTRKSDGVKGTLMFDHSPRVYYSFKADSDNPLVRQATFIEENPEAFDEK